MIVTRSFRARSLRVAGVLTLAGLVLGGCATYTTPGQAASFRALGILPEEAAELTDPSIAERLDRKPLASFPATVAILRVQGRGYHSHTTRGFGHGNFTVVSTRDVERDEDYDRIATLPMIRSLVPLNRFVLPDRITSEMQLRRSAAEVQADMLLVYTFDTIFGSESKLAPLSVVTIGLFPEREARVTSTVSAALIDTRNGYIYGLAEATATNRRVANAWTNTAAVDETRRQTEREAFEKAVDEFERLWRGVAAKYVPEGTT